MTDEPKRVKGAWREYQKDLKPQDIHPGKITINGVKYEYDLVSRGRPHVYAIEHGSRRRCGMEESTQVMMAVTGVKSR